MPTRRRLQWALLGLLALAALTACVYPLYVIRPFRAQGAQELALALMVRRWGPPLAIVAAAAALLLTVQLWRASRRWGRVLAVGLAGTSILFAALAQVNIFELAFHGINSPTLASAQEAKIEPDDRVLAIKAGGQARAYPIRMMGYHHIVNDTLGGEPIVATY